MLIVLRSLIVSSFFLPPDRTWILTVVWIPLMIFLSLPLHPSPGCTWFWSIVRLPFIWSSHPILVICLQDVREFGLFNTLYLIIPSRPLHLSCPQDVREFGQLIEYLISIILSHPLYDSRMYVDSVNCLKILSDNHHHSPVSRLYVNLLNCLKI